jgi:hypothetical protein
VTFPRLLECSWQGLGWPSGLTHSRWHSLTTTHSTQKKLCLGSVWTTSYPHSKYNSWHLKAPMSLFMVLLLWWENVISFCSQNFILSLKWQCYIFWTSQLQSLVLYSVTSVVLNWEEWFGFPRIGLSCFLGLNNRIWTLNDHYIIFTNSIMY